MFLAMIMILIYSELINMDSKFLKICVILCSFIYPNDKHNILML